MCYFEQLRWECGYWRWSHFRQQCTKKCRTGETCGLKLVYSVADKAGDCKLCKDIGKKKRRLEKMGRDIARWRGEGNRVATIETTEEEAALVEQQVADLSLQHRNRVQGNKY